MPVGLIAGAHSVPFHLEKEWAKSLPSGRNPTRRRLPERCTERKKELFLLHLVVSRSAWTFSPLPLSLSMSFLPSSSSQSEIHVYVGKRRWYKQASIWIYSLFFLEIWTSFLEIRTSFSRTNYWLLFRTWINLNLSHKMPEQIYLWNAIHISHILLIELFLPLYMSLLAAYLTFGVRALALSPLIYLSEFRANYY